MRPCFARVLPPAALALLLAAASCAPVAPAPVPGPTAAAIGAATVLTVRPIAATTGGDGGGWRAALLDGAGETGGPAPPAAASLAEFIVRVDDGATLSIVQPNDAALRVGERVILARPSAATGSPRLVRPL